MPKRSLQVSAAVRLFLALWLAITPTFVWAGSMTLMGVGGAAAGGGSCSQSTAFLARNGNANHTATDNLICGLVTDGVWSGFDAFWIMATDTAGHAILNAVSTSFTLSPQSSPTFTASQGYTTNGSTSYIDTTFNDSASGTQWSPSTHSESLGLCILTNNNGGVDFGAYDSVSIVAEISANFGGNALYGVNAAQASQANVSTTGTWSVSRTASTTTSLYKGASSTPFATDATAETTAVNTTFIIGARNSLGTAQFFINQQYAFAWIGKGFSGSDYLKIQGRLSTYMTAIGSSGC